MRLEEIFDDEIDFDVFGASVKNVLAKLVPRPKDQPQTTERTIAMNPIQDNKVSPV